MNILEYLPTKRKAAGSGWISFNAPCCVHNGESADRRQRGGIKSSEQGWSYHCFNCEFTASFVLGRNLSFKARKFLSWINVPQEEIERINLESLRHRSVQGILDSRRQTENTLLGLEFEESDLPPNAELVTAEHSLQWDYLRTRGVPEDYPILSVIKNDKVHWTRHNVIVPFTWNNTIVGWSARMLSGAGPKYINSTQPGYVFGTDLQRQDWQHVIVVEGVFDALSIAGLAVLHADINDAQSRLIRSLGKEITVVPDQDEAGMKLVDRAQELGWSVSMPDWPADIKDVNDAVRKFGRFPALAGILRARTSSAIKIELQRKKIIARYKKNS